MDELPNDSFDSDVAETTDSSTWKRMKTVAAEERILDQLAACSRNARHHRQQSIQPEADESGTNHRHHPRTDGVARLRR